MIRFYGSCGNDVVNYYPPRSFTGIAVSGLNVTIGGTIAQAGNVISGHSSAGVEIFGDGVSDHFHLVQGNYIGTDATGTRAVANQVGIVISLAKKMTIGGDIPSARNVISGNLNEGVQIVPNLDHLGCAAFVPGPTPPPPTVNFLVIGNYIGTDASGTLPLGNGGSGVEVFSNAFSH